MEPASYRPSEATEERSPAKPIVAPSPVFPVFLDLPLLDGAEVPHAPHIGVSATPWPGQVAVWSSPSDDGYRLNRLISVPTTVGVTETPLLPARSGLFDRGQPLRVKVYGGVLSSAEELAVLNGVNVAAIGEGSTAGWEVFQFARAELVAPQTYELTGRLRGQVGSEADMPDVWPVGSQIVFLGRGLEQIDLPASARGLERNYRIGAAQRGYDDTNVVVKREAFAGIGLRPYRPVHLAIRAGEPGGVDVSWIRRTRLDGDGWQIADVPLGEDREAYRVRVLVGGDVVRIAEVATPSWRYTAAMRSSDGTTMGCRIAISQISDRFGPGPEAVADLTG